jgi:hypothetical protein
MPRFSLSFFTYITIIQALVSNPVSAENVQFVERIQFQGDIKAPEDLSAVGQMGQYLIVGSDEGTGNKKNKNIVQVLVRQEDNRYQVIDEIFLFKGDKDSGKEMDIEGIAVENSQIFVIGSHSRKRKRQKKEASYKKNRSAFTGKGNKHEVSRERLYRLDVDSSMKVRKKDSISLGELIRQHEVLAAFAKIPSKENGIDIEGIAIHSGLVYVGFRGPVFRDNYVPIMRFDFDDPEDTIELLFVNLGGRGIRDMARVAGGFLILAGPVGDAIVSYQLFHWNGKDLVQGDNQKPGDEGKITYLGEIGTPEGGKAEGLLVLNETDQSNYELIVIYDGVPNGMPMRYRVSKLPLQ